MALTESNTFNQGTKAPDFILLNTLTGSNSSLAELRGKNGTVVMFICNHCPFVIHVNTELVRIANDYNEKGISFIAISSNDISQYPQDGPKKMKETAQQLGYPFPYLYDESQAVAKAYNAACTPDFYLFNDNLESVYHGQLDGSRPGNSIPLTGTDLRRALDNVIAQAPPIENQMPSIGCSIKWK